MSFGAVAASYAEVAAEPATYTVFGDAPPSYTLNIGEDGAPSIEVGNLFYLTDTNGEAIGYVCKGARVWIPNDPRVTGKPITMRAAIGTTLGTPMIEDDGWTSAIKSTTTPVAGGWCEVEWDEPFTVDYGPDNFHLLVTYKFIDPADQMKYMYAGGLPSSSIPSVDIGSTLELANENGGFPRGPRGKYRIGTGESQSTTGWYGVDVIIEESPLPASRQPVAAYGFNESGGVVANDATSGGHHLDTQPQYFAAIGHSGGGLQQLAAGDMAIDDTFVGLDTPTQTEFTIMFWGKYDSVGTPGNNWTINQSVETNSNIGWGVMLSDGTDTVFRLRIQGATANLTHTRQPTGEWHHYAVTGNSFYSRAYVDGVVVATHYQVGIVAADNDQNLRIFGDSMQGQAIDDLRFFAHALSPAAIGYYMDRGV